MRSRSRGLPISEGLIRAILDAVDESVHGTTTEEVCGRLGESPQDLGDAFEFVKERGILLGFAGVWFHPERYEKAAKGFLAALADLHRSDPGSGAVAPSRIARTAGLDWPHKTAARVAADLVAERRLKGDPLEGVRLPEFRPRLDARQELAIERVGRALDAGGFAPLVGSSLAAAVHLPVGALQEVLRSGEHLERLVPLENGIWLTTGRLAEARDLLTQVAGGGALTIGAARTALGTSRRYAHAIVTRLVGDGELEPIEGGWRAR